MDLGLRGRTALVSGSSKGIGKAIALGLAREGCAVALCARTESEVQATAAMIAAETGVETMAMPADLTRTADADAFVAAAAARFGRIDILVNNAGSARGGVIDRLTDEDWEQALQLKFLGYVRCIRAVLPHMRRQGGGRVVNLIGNDGVKPSYWEIAPGAANAAGQNLTLSLAGQFGRENITFVAVNPGPVRTERWDGLVHAMARDMKIPHAEADTLAPRSIPLGRIAEPEEVADLVVFLASDRARFVNGTMIEIDGGQQKPLMDVYRDG
jgi:NAD(P)-dependent dehydrogenase (short-subunit alcohol dehydrogenase family)